jgi:Zn-finger nucleic acid-binding protein
MTVRPKANRRQSPRAAPDFARTRARLDAKLAKQRRKMLWAHYWLLCPKCGGDMFVNRTMGIHYEVCRDCHGIYLNGDEVALLLAHLDPGKALRAILKHSKKPDTTEI